jgi:DNA repair exonuclease SbcCD ATPase subunit
MEEEYPRIRSLGEGIDTLFPFLTTTERKELLDGIRRALMEVLGDAWGKREISVDEMREKMREKLRDEIEKIETIPEDERERILSRIEKLIPAEELVRLKGKIKQSLLDRIKLKESVIGAFKEILKKNLGEKVKPLEEIEKSLDEIRKKLEKKDESALAEKEESRRIDQDKVLEEVKSELNGIEKKLDDMLKKKEKEGERVKEFESECKEELISNIKDELNKVQISLWERVNSEIKKIEEKIKEIEGKIGEIEEIKKVRDKIDKIKSKKVYYKIDKEIIEKYGIEKEIEKLCEEIEKSVDISALLVEGAERIIVDNMNRMVRKDLGLYVSWSLGNPLRELYYRVRGGEEI